MTVEWSVDIQVIKPLPSFERPLRVEVETQSNASYCHEGKYYQNKERMIILYTLSGQGLYEDEKATYPLEPETCLLCNPGDPTICYKYPPGNTTPWRFLWFGFTGACTHTKAEELRRQFGPVYTLSFESEIIHRLETLRSHNGFVFEMSPFEGASLVLEVFSALGESQLPHFENRPNNLLIQKALTLINAQLNEKTSICKISQQLRVSREHLSRIFKEHIGTSIQQYILQKKIQIACKLLKESNLSVKEVSFHLGFQDQRNFARTFKKHFGMTPRDFKQSGVAAMHMKT